MKKPPRYQMYHLWFSKQAYKDGMLYRKYVMANGNVVISNWIAYYSTRNSIPEYYPDAEYLGVGIPVENQHTNW